MIPRPWRMTPEEIASADEAVRSLLSVDVARLLRPILRHEHAPVVEAVGQLHWDEDPVDVLATKALTVLKGAAMPGGPVDLKDDDADVVWVVALNRIASAPAVASRLARAWYVHGMRLLWDDAEVSTVAQAMAAYAVARFEDALHNRHEVARWMMIAAIETEADERTGLGLAVVVRAARLCSWGLK